ncbi:AMP-dependent synthetase/ligase [Microbacterium sp. CPCC 204701]|uniref:AMP-dependent synthetase/ligase n=1 Tax=Microbacterium sp. CPCC 204701 TaxID=2493084 RepID=UPI000FDBBAD7|nr:AMP-binding protein [Microbacterium sp. CPCC 204701]
MKKTLIAWLQPHLRSGNPAAAQRFRGSGGWVTRSYGELWSLVRRTSVLLSDAGAGRGRPVVIVAQTSPTWTIVDLAAATIGAPVVPVYPTSSFAQVADVITRVAPAVVVTDRTDIDAAGATVLGWGTDADSLGDLDRPELSGSEEVALDLAAAEVSASDVFSIVFSSGSTGTPKGCVLTHANYTAVLSAAAEVEAGGPDGAAHRAHSFVYLPLAHVSARLQQLTTLTLGGELVYGAGGTADILGQIRETEPTYVPGVPRLFESAYLRAGEDAQRLRESFGPRLRYALTGGAPIDPDILATYAAAGIPLVEGYGLTETSAALTLCAPHVNRQGSVGRALPGVQLRIAHDGEVLARGANIFAGYLDDPDATRAAFVDGWFATGDLGRLDGDGFLYITGRKKNLLVTSTGKNIAPEPVENRLRSAFGLDDAILVGDRRPYLSALVFAERVDETALVQGIGEMNALVSPPEQVRRVVVIPHALRSDAGELTASGKVVRSVVLDRHARLIDDLYAGRAVSGARLLEVDVRLGGG